MDFRLSYLRTKDDAEIDIIVERPGAEDLLVEIKSTTHVSADDYQTLVRFAKDWDRPCKAQVWSLDEMLKRDGDIECLPWTQGLKQLFHQGL